MRYAAICDDSKVWLDRASGVLEAYLKERSMDMRLFCYNDIEKCIEELPADPGVLFMDIEWEEPSDKTGPSGGDSESLPRGIDAAEEINRRRPECRIVYLTNHLGYALDVYHTEHAWYVLKDQFEERLPEVFEKLEKLEEEGRRSIVVRTLAHNTVRLNCSAICYIERTGRKTRIVTNNDELEVRSKVADIESLLPASGFARCHNSIIVNLARVKEIHQGQLLLDKGHQLPISRGRGRTFRTEYMNYVKERSL